MKFIFTLFSSTLLCLSSFATSVDSLRAEQRGDTLFVIHEVEEKETLYSIARRYKSTTQAIVKNNPVVDNKIDVGQVLEIPYDVVETEAVLDTHAEVPAGYHRVDQGETLYSISKLYDTKVRMLKTLNDLTSNDLSPGMLLKIEMGADSASLEAPQDVAVVDSTELESVVPEGYELYYVQTGETLVSIAREKGLIVEDIKQWNKLDSDYIRIGQKLLLELKEAASDSAAVVELNDDGFERVYEKGIAAIIPDISTTKFLALHRKMPIGTELRVRNLMNNLVVHVKVIGKLPDTGVNRNILLRLSKPAYEQLGILDSRSRVEVSHFKE